MLAGRFDSAEFHFRELIRIDPAPDLVRQYRSFLRAIDSSRPVSFRTFGAILPSTNVNRGTRNATFNTDIGQFVIDPESRATSGIGAELGGSASFRLPVDLRSRFLVNSELSGRMYENPDFNSATGTLSASYEYAFAQGRWQAGPYARYAWREDQQGHFALGGQASLGHRLTDTMTAQASGLYEHRTFPDRAFRDGGYFAGTLAVSRQIDPSLSVTLGAGVDRNAPAAPHQRYRGVRVFGGASRQWIGGYDTSVRLEYGRRLFDSDFPLTTAPRRDSFWSISASILNTDVTIAGFAPQLSCSYLDSASNIAFFEFDTTECRIGLTANF